MRLSLRPRLRNPRRSVGVTAIGLVALLSISLAAAGQDSPAKQDQESPPAQKTSRDQRIEEIVKKAMGYSAERQDEVEVVNVQFGLEADAGAGTAAEEPAGFAKWQPYLRYGVSGVLFLLILLFVVRPLVAALTALIVRVMWEGFFA